MKNGQPEVCVNDQLTGECVAPYPNHSDMNGGGPHSATNAVADMNGGRWTALSSKPGWASQVALILAQRASTRHPLVS